MCMLSWIRGLRGEHAWVGPRSGSHSFVHRLPCARTLNPLIAAGVLGALNAESKALHWPARWHVYLHSNHTGMRIRVCAGRGHFQEEACHAGASRLQACSSTGLCVCFGWQRSQADWLSPSGKMLGAPLSRGCLDRQGQFFWLDIGCIGVRRHVEENHGGCGWRYAWAQGLLLPLGGTQQTGLCSTRLYACVLAWILGLGPAWRPSPENRLLTSQPAFNKAINSALT